MTQYLSSEEINAFIEDLDANNNGFIDYHEVETKLDLVHDEIAPIPQEHNLHHESAEGKQRHAFLRSVMGTDQNRIPREEFFKTVESWNVPSLNPDKTNEEGSKEYMKRMAWGRRVRAWWSVRGTEVLFLFVVISMQLAFGIWQLVKYLTATAYRPAFGWGVVFAKTCAGVLYPTLFFLLLSMSRYLNAVARKSYYLSRMINWDLTQSFHIKISIVAMIFATLHAIGHLTGSFLYSSRPAQREAVIAAVGVQRSYREYASLLPGWTGITALGTFYLIALLSLPIIRKKHYEIFQLGHLLMYPFIGLVCAHGALGLLQYPMLGFWLIIPALLILVERCVRVSYGFHNIPAKLEVLDADTVAITVVVPQKRYWKYRAGQWVFITVPELSIFQWHPFTISTCIGHDMQLHIKTDGDWTSGLRKLAGDGGVANIKICVDGPFGAPAQRFYEFDYTMIIGSGIGVTPFSGILTDLQAREERYQQHLPHVSTQTHIGQGESTPHASNPTEKPPWQTTEAPVYRRVDFHWIVKDKNYLLWFSNLLNSISRSTLAERADDVPHLDVRLQTHVTQKRKNISTHVYRYLLELHRTVEHPESPITGLINETHFGRPSLAEIMDEHYESMLQTIRETKEKGLEIRKRRVGVFFCGAPPIGYELADRCHAMTVRGREDKSYIEYFFMMEVFG